MNEQITNKILGYIETIGKAASDTAKYGFELIVKQQVVSGLVDVITIVAFLLATYFAFRYSFKLTKKKRDEIDQKVKNGWYVTEIHEDFIKVIPWITASVFTFCIVISIIVIPESIAKIINPEYYAIKEILETLK
jgi:hypothetical protein